MANVLIVYATREGQTRKIAERIASGLCAHGHAAELCDVAQLGDGGDRIAAGGHDAVVMGASVHLGGYGRAMTRFVRRQRAFLERVPSAFFSVSMAVASDLYDGRAETIKIVERFIARTGFRPERVELFAGALMYSKYNWLVRSVMRRIAAKEGGSTDTSRDHEYTDWAAVDRFAEELARRLSRGCRPLASRVTGGWQTASNGQAPRSELLLRLIPSELLSGSGSPTGPRR